MTTQSYEATPLEQTHWWDTVRPWHLIHREVVRWITPGQSLVGRVVRVQDILVARAAGAKSRKRRVYFFDAVDGRKLLIWGTGAFNDWFTCRPALLFRLVRIRYLGVFVDGHKRTHLRFSIRPAKRSSNRNRSRSEHGAGTPKEPLGGHRLVPKGA